MSDCCCNRCKLSTKSEWDKLFPEPATFFEVGKQYNINGNTYTILAVAETMYGPLAWATFPRGGGQDCQTLCQVHFDETTITIPVLPPEPEDPYPYCPECDGFKTVSVGEKWDGFLDPPYPVYYCDSCQWEEEV